MVGDGVQSAGDRHGDTLIEQVWEVHAKRVEAWATRVPRPLLQHGPPDAVQEPPITVTPAKVRPPEVDVRGPPGPVPAVAQGRLLQRLVAVVERRVGVGGFAAQA